MLKLHFTAQPRDVETAPQGDPQTDSPLPDQWAFSSREP
jgi:hypothetical protein